MQQYYDLEISIMSCLMLKPELMEELIIDDYYFAKHQRLWQFMKAFYKKYKTFDVILMANACKDRYKMVKYLQELADYCVIVNVDIFEKYQEQLKELYHQKKKDKWLAERIYSLANDLYVGNINLEEFETKKKQLEKVAKDLFKEEDKDDTN